MCPVFHCKSDGSIGSIIERRMPAHRQMFALCIYVCTFGNFMLLSGHDSLHVSYQSEKISTTVKKEEKEKNGKGVISCPVIYQCTIRNYAP
jgi:hypothetical protein